MNKQIKQIYEFGPFIIDADERLLTRDGRLVPLPPKVFDTLLALVENSGRILGKDELMKLLWPDTFVEESNLTQNISQLRRALGGEYIETIPKRGYRFVADLKMASNGNSSLEAGAVNGHTYALGPDVVDGEISNSRLPVPVVEDSSAPLSRKRILATASLLLFSLAIVVFALVLAYRRSNNHSKTAFQQISLSKLTTSGKTLLPTISRDGKYVAYATEDGDLQSLWVRQVAAASSNQIVAPADTVFMGVTFSLDDNFIYYVARQKNGQEGKLFQIPLLGGTPQEVMADVDSPITFSPNGQYFAFVRNYPQEREASLIIAKLDGTEDRRLLTRKRPAMLSLLGPAWSPDGRAIACGAGAAGQGESSMHVLAVNIEDGSAHPIGNQTWTSIGQVAWLGDGSGIVFSGWRRTSAVYGDQLFLLSYPQGEVRRVTNDMTSYEGVSVSASSGAMVSRRTDRVSRIWIVPRGEAGFDAARATQIQSGFGDNYSERFGLDWTPEGNLVYASHASGNLDVWSTAADGKQQKQLTRDLLTDIVPVASPDGRFIVFVSERAGGSNIWRMDADGSNPKQLTRGKAEFYPTLSPDGLWVVYTAATNGRSALWKVSIDGGEPVQLSDKTAMRPVVSPDGKWIACFYYEQKENKVRPALFPFGGGDPNFIEGIATPDFWHLRWTPDGRVLTYILTRNGVANIWSKPIDGGQARQLTNFTTDQIFRFAWSRDGKRLACERGMVINDAVLISSIKSD